MTHEITFDTLDVLGVGVSRLESYRHAETVIADYIRDKRQSLCVAINPEKIQTARNDKTLMDILNSAEIQICDGVGVAIAVRILYGTNLPRVTGVQLFMNLMAVAERDGFRVFLLGASPESNESACEALKHKHPGLVIAGRNDGYFRDDASVIEKINDSGADMLFVAMGSPRQEKWIIENRNAIKASFCMGVGGTFDVLSGRAKWAPAIFRRTGTEFLFRLMSDPARWKRQIVYFSFAYEVMKRKLNRHASL